MIPRIKIVQESLGSSFGEGATITSPTNINNCKIGNKVTISPFCNIYGCEIEDDVFIGPFTEIQAGVKVGRGSRIQSHSFVASGAEIGEDCFWGHGAISCNDKHPKANNKNWKCEKLIIGNSVSIGSGAILFPVLVGDGAVIGAGAVVLRDVEAGATVVGNPARKVFKNVPGYLTRSMTATLKG